jgi:hypothetical protein
MSLIGGVTSIFAIQGASASIVQDIPASVSESLGISVGVAGLILSCGILLSIALIISMAGRNSNMIATSAVMIGTVGALTAIGWLYSWVIIMLVIIIALMFGGAMRDWSESSKKAG